MTRRPCYQRGPISSQRMRLNAPLASGWKGVYRQTPNHSTAKTFFLMIIIENCSASTSSQEDTPSYDSRHGWAVVLTENRLLFIWKKWPHYHVVKGGKDYHATTTTTTKRVHSSTATEAESGRLVGQWRHRLHHPGRNWGPDIFPSQNPR